MSFSARFAGRCASVSCTRPIQVDDAVVYVDQDLMHDECALDGGALSSIAPLTRSICDSCFTEVSVSGGCMC
jgi:hypothetical protein